MSQIQTVEGVATQLPEPFRHAVLGRVDQYCVYVSRFLGTYKYHAHDRDEMYLVLSGEIFIEFQGGDRVRLSPLESLVVTAGQVHRSGADVESLVLMFKACDLFAE